LKSASRTSTIPIMGADLDGPRGLSVPVAKMRRTIAPVVTFAVVAEPG
jgi:hypothetical protein